MLPFHIIDNNKSIQIIKEQVLLKNTHLPYFATLNICKEIKANNNGIIVFTGVANSVNPIIYDKRAGSIY